MARELENIARRLESKEIRPVKASVKEDLETYRETLRKLGLETQAIDVHFVDSFPEPYTSDDFTSILCDEWDEEWYGMEPGVYLKNKALLPFKSSLLTAHEIIHLCVASHSDKSMLGRGMEEGLCDLIGPLKAGSEVFSSEECINYLKNWRLADFDNRTWIRYRKNLVQGCSLYLKYGIRGLVDLIKSGRERVVDVEKKLLQGKMNFHLEKGGFREDWKDFANLAINFDTTLTVSPLARLLAEKVEKGKSVEQILKENNIKKNAGRKAFEELSGSEAYVIILSDGEIDADRTETYLEGKTLRYEID